jgi:hypothetical protein
VSDLPLPESHFVQGQLRHLACRCKVWFKVVIGIYKKFFEALS